MDSTTTSSIDSKYEISDLDQPVSVRLHRAPLFLLYLNVMIIASCGLVYELLAGTLASYVLGDSVTQFSLVIGVYLFALGVGAWISGFVTRNLARVFIEVELAVALIGGCSAPVLFLAFGYVSVFHFTLFAVVLAIGILVGLELPLLMRILQTNVDFKDLVSRVLTFDYIGALAASLMFPLFLVPQLGLVRTSFAIGLINALIGLWGTSLLKPLLRGKVGGLQGRAILVIGLLCVGIIKADSFTQLAEELQFGDPIVYAKTSPYQRIVVTKTTNNFHLFLNGNLQFHSADEYRYHEALVHPAFAKNGEGGNANTNTNANTSTSTREGEGEGEGKRARINVLVLGGGDGLALREIFRYDNIESVTLVDIDPAMTGLGKSFPLLKELNQSSFDNPRLEVVNEDALVWLGKSGKTFDVVIIDFPDPSSFSVGKLYTTAFYRRLAARLSPSARITVQCTAPLTAPKSYWCVVKTLETAGFHVLPYRAGVPSFGEWGFVLASLAPVSPPNELFLAEPAKKQLRFLDDVTLKSLFALPPDMAQLVVEPNRWDNQILVRYYESEWSQWR